MNADCVIVGLGNPGPRYAMTRHNVGFMALDLLVQQQRALFSNSGLGAKIQGEWAETTIEQKRLLLLKPLTFMNLSGESVAKLYQLHAHLRERPLIVFHDEADLPFGRIKVKFGGSDAGQNGLKSLREQLGHGDFFRVRLGIGKPVMGSGQDLASHVLAPFQKAELEKLSDMLIQSTLCLIPLLAGNLQESQRIAALDSPAEKR